MRQTIPTKKAARSLPYTLCVAEQTYHEKSGQQLLWLVLVPIIYSSIISKRPLFVNIPGPSKPVLSLHVFNIGHLASHHFHNPTDKGKQHP
jgi:hypothetical protein